MATVLDDDASLVNQFPFLAYAPFKCKMPHKRHGSVAVGDAVVNFALIDVGYDLSLTPLNDGFYAIIPPFI